MFKKGEYVRIKKYERKITSSFMIYDDWLFIYNLSYFDDGMLNPDESYTNKYQKQVTCSYGNNLVYIDDKFSKPFKSNLGDDAVYNFINTTLEESKYCSDVMKKHFNRAFVITQKDVKDFFTKQNKV